MTDSTRVLVADDHDLFRVGLASALAAYDDIEVVAQASGGGWRYVSLLSCDQMSS